MYTDVAAALEEIMELLREKVVEQLDVLIRNGIEFQPEEFYSLSESGRLAKIVRDFRKIENKRKHSSDEESSTAKRTRNSTSDESSSYDENDDGIERDPPNGVIVSTYQTTECQTDPMVKQDASTQTDDVMI